MLDIKFIRENKELVKDAVRKKCLDCNIDKLLKLDEERRRLMGQVEDLRNRQNTANQEISQVQQPGEREKLIEQMKVLKEELQTVEAELKTVKEKWLQAMVEVPNLPDITVPEGQSDEDNLELRTWGEKPRWDSSFKDHIQLLKDHDLADLERGVKVAGFRGYFLKNEAAMLSLAIWHFVTDHLVATGHYTPMIAPTLLRKESFIGTGYLPQGEEDLYKTQDETYLAGTSEVATMGYFLDEVLEYTDLPRKFVVFSPCFRREAGSYGKDTKGLIRLHEFYKVEQVVLCEASHQESVEQHEGLTDQAEQIMQKLELPYRVVVNCGGDLGLGQVKKYDIEAWVPSEKKYRETHSVSYFHDFQARRLNIKYRDQAGKLRFVHSLNGTAIATPRVLASLLECNQKADGSIVIPQVLRPYLQGKESISTS